ncbi:hypothetical protein MMSP_2427 [Mycobacterium sp. 012931]|nr:hypothetical protein MMSP_2427 [Mycobacterium sp. 012931]
MMFSCLTADFYELQLNVVQLAFVRGYDLGHGGRAVGA